MTFEQTLGLKGPKVNVNILHVKKGLSLKNASQIKFTLTAVKLYLKKLSSHFLWMRSTVSRLQSEHEETVYFLSLSPKKILVLS